MPELKVYIEADGQRLIDSTSKYNISPLRQAIICILDAIELEIENRETILENKTYKYEDLLSNIEDKKEELSLINAKLNDLQERLTYAIKT